MAQPTVQGDWTERNATRQAHINMPGLNRGKREFVLFPYGPKPSEFDRYGQYVWFYVGWFITRLSSIVAVLLIILDLRLYLRSEGEPDMKCLALTVAPSGTVLVWIVIDAFLRKKTWPRGRLGVEGVVVVGMIVCLALLGVLAGAKAGQGDSFAGWYAGLSGVLGILLLLRLLRLGELYYTLRHPEYQ